jgi:hypothetical protein
MAISSDGHRELFPFLSDRVRKKKKENKIENLPKCLLFWDEREDERGKQSVYTTA